jgi:hypothetical protein
MILDLTKPIEPSADPAVLHALLTALLGQRCLKADMSYGGELMLHIGEPVPYRHPKLADEQKGSWILGTRASGWRLLLNEPAVLIESGWFPDPWKDLISGEGGGDAGGMAERSPLNLNGEQIEEKTRLLAGRTILAARTVRLPLPLPVAWGIGLIIEFEGGSSLAVVPSPEPDEGDDLLADWELFTPYRTYLRVGPGPVWAYLRSDASLAETA